METSFDLIVVGAGPAGTSAAIAAGRLGLKVLLIERYGFSGGMAVNALVGPYAGICWRNPETGRCGDITGGLFREIRDRLLAEGALSRELFSNDDDFFYETFNENTLKYILERLLIESGVKVLYHSLLVSAEKSDTNIDKVVVATKEGLLTFAALLFIDSTGDADLYALCGGKTEIGRSEDGLCQPVSLMFRMGGVDKKRLFLNGLKNAREEISVHFVNDKNNGLLDYPYKNWVQFYDYPVDGQLLFNMTRVLESDALCAEKLSFAEIEARRQAYKFSSWIKARVPGFEDSWFDVAGAQVGVRETRRIDGEFKITADHILNGVRFDDGIARSGYIMDIHNPKSATDIHVGTSGVQSVNDNFKPKKYYEIPYRSLQPKQFSNLLVACRAISTTHEAHAATRVMPTMHSVGEAAGIAASFALKVNNNFKNVKGQDIRQNLPFLDQELSF
ncbi:MAG: FAD-dependent oxidoreductase [Fibrobacteres bacterium]|nr:FAD-dependent oxidoreductase [Fibrobacterota bacterium]